MQFNCYVYLIIRYNLMKTFRRLMNYVNVSLMFFNSTLFFHWIFRGKMNPVVVFLRFPFVFPSVTETCVCQDEIITNIEIWIFSFKISLGMTHSHDVKWQSYDGAKFPSKYKWIMTWWQTFLYLSGNSDASNEFHNLLVASCLSVEYTPWIGGLLTCF